MQPMQPMQRPSSHLRCYSRRFLVQPARSRDNSPFPATSRANRSSKVLGSQGPKTLIAGPKDSLTSSPSRFASTQVRSSFYGPYTQILTVNLFVSKNLRPLKGVKQNSVSTTCIEPLPCNGVAIRMLGFGLR
ncbi:predicted protein [Histoplasma capsulatum G186AR]|uniref:Uncharacterized protein n=1 Tax=Ajellomyces capsulatus (strain G186AR / H82 / ATCC MYA-2454 / RMSCC 2432) TaxID=447093 RepID=C0NSG7_AJECG|nr:uncharacterized protein HCBG_06097 [Histoplasma capsulatum G186AR]EEH05833.1 predicted protein [Histoplasma capsulatum G186AR]